MRNNTEIIRHGIGMETKHLFSKHTSSIQGLNPNSTITEDSSPLDFFCLFFDSEILTVIQNETKKYAEQQINKKKQEGPLKTKSVHAQWKEVNFQEIKHFLTVIIHMCLVKKPYLRDNWMTDPVMQTTDAKSVGMSHD
jgi:hypothetical protein